MKQKNSRPVKVCVAGSVFPRFENDTEVPWHRETLRRCREKGIDITAFAPSFSALKSHTIDGIPVKRFRYFPGRWETLTHDEGAPNRIHKLRYKIISVFYIVCGTFALVSLHAKERFDVLHIHWPFPHAFFGYVAKVLFPTRIILNFHGASLLLAHQYPFVRIFLRWFIAHADGIIANSAFTAARINEVYPCSPVIIPYGTTITAKAGSETTHLSEDPEILAVGRLIERKGFTYLVKAIPALLKKYPRARLTIVGGGPEADGLRALVTQLHLNDAVTLAGKVSEAEKENLFSRSSVFVVPSIVDSKGDTEGLGVVIVEALTFRKPVVASEVGGIPDLVIHEKTGLLVPQKDSNALSSAILRILDQPEFSLRLGDNGYDHIRKNYDWEVLIPRLLTMYQSMACPAVGRSRSRHG